VGIDEMEAEELAWYYRETLNAARVKPLRGFHDFCKALDDGKEEIRWVPRRDGERTRDLRRVRRPRLNRRPAGLAPNGQTRQLENVVLGRTAPHPWFSDICEPCSIVLGFTDRPTTALGRSGIDMIMARAEQASRWAERNQQAAPVIVHIKTSDGPTSSMTGRPPFYEEGHHEQPSIIPMPTKMQERGNQDDIKSQIKQPYEPTRADYEALANFYREIRPGITDALLRVSMASCAALYEGPIGSSIKKMRARIKPTRAVAESAKVIALPVRLQRIRCFTQTDYAEMDRMAV